jgi:hypothetical protein
LSGIITDNRLYLGGDKKLHIFEVNTSLSELSPVTVIDTMGWVNKILRVGHQLILGQDNGYLQVVDISTANITSTH